MLRRLCQVPELSLVDGSGWGGPWGSLEDGVKMGAEGYREMVQRHPCLAGVYIADRGNGMVVELVGGWCKCWG